MSFLKIVLQNAPSRSRWPEGDCSRLWPKLPNRVAASGVTAAMSWSTRHDYWIVSWRNGVERLTYLIPLENHCRREGAADIWLWLHLSLTATLWYWEKEHSVIGWQEIWLVKPLLRSPAQDLKPCSSQDRHTHTHTPYIRVFLPFLF